MEAIRMTVGGRLGSRRGHILLCRTCVLLMSILNQPRREFLLLSPRKHAPCMYCWSSYERIPLILVLCRIRSIVDVVSKNWHVLWEESVLGRGRIILRVDGPTNK